MKRKPFPELHPTNYPKETPEGHSAQWLLAGHNRFKIKTYTGNLDGRYGDRSGHAADRARYWLGFSRWNLAGRFGEQIYSYLLPSGRDGAKALPPLYKARRKARLIKEARRQKRSKKALALARALSKVGVHEVGYSNWNEFGAWFGYNGVAWCAEFVSWAFSPWYKFRTASAFQFLWWANAGMYGLRLTQNPEPGDIVVFVHGQGHVEIFRQGSARYFQSCGGNTSCSGGSWDNGGEVCDHWHGLEHNPRFIRVP